MDTVPRLTDFKRSLKIMFTQTNTWRDPLLQPIGPAMVVAQLRRDGHEVVFVDLVGESDPVLAAREAAQKFQPELVCYSVRNRDNQSPTGYLDPIPEIRAVADAVREVSPVPSLIGGTAFTTYPARMMEALNADYGFAGDDLQAISRFVASMSMLAPDLSTPGLVYRTATGQVVENPFTLRGYAEVPFDHHEVIDQNRYRGALWQAAVVTRTGCPEKCAYCDSFHTFGSQFALREPDTVAEELLFLKQTGTVRAVFLVDGGFNRPLDHAKAVLEAIIRRDAQLQLFSVYDPGTADKEFFELYRRAGGKMLSMFAESLSDTVLAELGKWFTASDVLRDADAIRRAGLNLMWLPTFGGPGETPSTVAETLRLAPKIHATLSMMDAGWRIQPRTPLRDRAVREGLIAPDDDCWNPHFYISPQTPLPWLEQRLRAYQRRHPFGWLKMMSFLLRMKLAKA
jgi:anaerobic magnesium-protoporphyrin IX monomethyl ester cyclase